MDNDTNKRADSSSIGSIAGFAVLSISIPLEVPSFSYPFFRLMYVLNPTVAFWLEITAKDAASSTNLCISWMKERRRDLARNPSGVCDLQ